MFARDTAEIMAGAGVRAVLLPRLLPTPVLAFAVRHLDAERRRHGHRVATTRRTTTATRSTSAATTTGRRSSSPTDAEIAAAHPARRRAGDGARAAPSADFEMAADEVVVDEYMRRTARSSPARPAAQPQVVYTAMHGVGWQTARRVLRRGRLRRARRSSTAQIEPDPRVPDRRVPEPRGAGRDGPRFAHAPRDVGAELIVANDPDADRLAIAIPDARAERLPTPDAATRSGCCSVAGRASAPPPPATRGRRHPRVLHRLLAGARGGRATPTTSTSRPRSPGFKWISRAPGLVFGFEEALGYLVEPRRPCATRTASRPRVAFLSLAAELKAEGRTDRRPPRRVRRAIRMPRLGQVSIRVTDLARIGEIMARLRAEPPAADRRHPRRRASRTSPTASARCRRRDVLRIVLDGRRPRHGAPERHRAEAQGLHRRGGRPRAPSSERRAAASAAVAALEAGCATCAS